MGCFGVWPWRQYVHVTVSHEIKVWGSLKIGTFLRSPEVPGFWSLNGLVTTVCTFMGFLEI